MITKCFKCRNKRLKCMYIVLLIIIINKPTLYIFVKCKNCVFIILIAWDRFLKKEMVKAAGFEPRIFQI